MTPVQLAARNAWDTYLRNTYINTKGETKPTYASKWRASNPGRHSQILAYKNGTGPRPDITDGFGPMIVSVVDILLLTADPVQPPPAQPWDSGYPPRAYNQGSRGQNCIFNIRINCTQLSDGSYMDKHGLTYSDSGLCNGGRTETPAIPGLKQADMKDQAEPWDSYEWFGNVIGPDKENYPAASYER